MEVWPEVVLEVDLDLGSEEGFEMVESVGVDAVNKANVNYRNKQVTTYRWK